MATKSTEIQTVRVEVRIPNDSTQQQQTPAISFLRFRYAEAIDAATQQQSSGDSIVSETEIEDPIDDFRSSITAALLLTLPEVDVRVQGI